jgi:hypothetical protein
MCSKQVVLCCIPLVACCVVCLCLVCYWLCGLQRLPFFWEGGCLFERGLLSLIERLDRRLCICMRKWLTPSCMPSPTCMGVHRHGIVVVTRLSCTIVQAHHSLCSLHTHALSACDVQHSTACLNSVQACRAMFLWLYIGSFGQVHACMFMLMRPCCASASRGVRASPVCSRAAAKTLKSVRAAVCFVSGSAGAQY